MFLSPFGILIEYAFTLASVLDALSALALIKEAPPTQPEDGEEGMGPAGKKNSCSSEGKTFIVIHISLLNLISAYYQYITVCTEY